MKKILLVMLSAVITLNTAVLASRYGSWKYRRTVKDGTVIESVVTRALDSNMELQWVSGGGVPMIAVTGPYLAGDRDRQVLVRFAMDDYGWDAYEYWDIGSSGHTIFYTGDLELLTVAAIICDRMVVEITDPYDGEVIREVFDLRGFGPAFNDWRGN